MDKYGNPDIKLATPEQADKLFTDQLIAEGYRGVKYPAEQGQAEWTKLWFPNEDTLTKSQLTDFYEQAEREVKEVKPKKPLGLETAKNLADDAVPLSTSAPIEQGEQSAIQKLIKIVKEAVPVRKEQEALFSAERAKRVAQAARAGEAIPGEAGFFAQLSKLKGELPRAQFEAVR